MSSTRHAIASALLAAMFAGPTFAQQAASVIVEPVVVAEVTETAPVIAEFVATVESEVATRRDGVVRRVTFEVGDVVFEGQQLVYLDDQLISIQLQNAEAALEAARAGVDVALARVRLSEQAYARQARLRGSTAFSGGLFEDAEQAVAEAKSEVAVAEARVAIAQAALARVEYDAKHSIIVAPFDGIVISRSAQPGQYISLGGSVARLMDVERLEIEASVPVELIGGLKIGRTLDVVVDAGTVLEAEVRTLLPVENVSTRTRPVRLSVDVDEVPSFLLADGRSVTLQVPVSDPRMALLVPKDALVQGLGGQWRVFVAEEGMAVPRTVTIGQANGTRFEVLSGLAEGELVVVRGNERLQPGQPIVPKLLDDAGGDRREGRAEQPLFLPVRKG